MRLVLLLFIFCFINNKAFSQKEEYLAELRAKLAVAKDTMLANTLGRIGAFFLDENKYDSSVFYLQQALSLSEKINYKKGMYVSWINLGAGEYRKSRFAPALEYLQKALKAAEENNDERTTAMALSNIGELNVVIGNSEVGMKQLVQSEAALEKLKDTIALISVYVRMSQIFALNNKKEKTAEYLDKARKTCNPKLQAGNLTLKEKLSLQMLMRQILFSQSQQFRENKEFDQALILQKQLSEEMKTISGGREKVFYEFRTAEIYCEMKKYKEALEYCNSALDLLRTTGNIPDIGAEVYELRSEVYERTAFPDKALADLKMSHKIRAEIFNQEMLDKTHALIAGQEADQKNREITYLNKEKQTYKWLVIIAGILVFVTAFALFLILRSRKMQKKLLIQNNQITLHEKKLENNRLQIQLFELEQAALRAQMNPHFIFNSLNSIQHYVINRDIQGANRYISMLGSLIRLTLDYAAKPQILLSEELAYIDKYLSLEKMRMQDSFDYTITVNESVDRDNCNIPPMLLQPFVENAIKHGVKYLKDKKGEISIEVMAEGKGYKYLITDNGIGRQVTSSYKSNGANGHQSKGISLSEKRVALLENRGIQSSIEIIDLKDIDGNARGTQVVIIIPG
jgi:tetratricopeptide (TPR) repeat protein